MDTFWNYDRIAICDEDCIELISILQIFKYQYQWKQRLRFLFTILFLFSTKIRYVNKTVIRPRKTPYAFHVFT